MRRKTESLLGFAGVALGQSVISRPILLTVAEETRLSLDVDKDECDCEHTLSGRLLSNGDGVCNKQMKIMIIASFEGDQP
jgi:hypothetical protein